MNPTPLFDGRLFMVKPANTASLCLQTQALRPVVGRFRFAHHLHRKSSDWTSCQGSMGLDQPDLSFRCPSRSRYGDAGLRPGFVVWNGCLVLVEVALVFCFRRSVRDVSGFHSS